jgi:hypothetical protein
MAMIKFDVDTTNKLFIAKVGITSFNVQVDLYSDAKEHWIAGGVAMGFDFPIRTVGGDDIDTGAGTKIPTYCFLTNGWRLRPDEDDHTLDVTGGILLVDGGGDPFVDTVGAYTVRINYQQPVQAIAFTTSGIGLSENLEGSLSVADALRIILSAVAGKTNITTLSPTELQIAFRDIGDTKNRILATLEDSERTAVTRDGT